MEGVGRTLTITDPLLACCLCTHLLQEPVVLPCLHSCCRQCFSKAASQCSSQDVSCGLCGTVNQAGSEQPNGFIESQVQRYKSVTESRSCAVCRSNGDYEKPALMWCSACRHSLCDDCVTRHDQYFRQHVTRPLDELRGLDEVCSHAVPSARCTIHKKPLDIACLDCEQVKCISCWAECKEKEHEMHIVGNEAFDNYVGKLIVNISTIERELLLKSEVLEKPAIILRDTKAARDRHLEEIRTRKRRVVDAVETVYQEVECSTKNAYDDLEAHVEDSAAAADRVASDLSDARNYIARLVQSNDKCEILNQQKIVQERLNVLSAELDSLSDSLTTSMRELKIEAPLPEKLEDVVRTWIGMPLAYSALTSHCLPQTSVRQPQQQQQQHRRQQQYFLFGAPSNNVRLPEKCVDVALTTDGQSLLVAADQHGLIEFSSSSGQELSRWRPPKSFFGENVLAVAALNDGRIAVSLFYAHRVGLLRRSEKGGDSNDASAAGDTWTVDHCFELSWGPQWLSVHNDVLAVCKWLGSGLHLLSLSNGMRLNDAELRCEYKIGSVAVASGLLVTGSSSKVKLGSGRRSAYVLDAHHLARGGNERPWRHELSNDKEKLRGICADTTRGCLYAAVHWGYYNSGRLSVLSLADGSELGRIALSFESPVCPVRLSLRVDGETTAEQPQSSNSSERGVLLAVLCANEAMVTLHRSTREILQ